MGILLAPVYEWFTEGFDTADSLACWVSLPLNPTYVTVFPARSVNTKECALSMRGSLGYTFQSFRLSLGRHDSGRTVSTI